MKTFVQYDRFQSSEKSFNWKLFAIFYYNNENTLSNGLTF